MAALSDLVDRTQLLGRVKCTFVCPKPVEVADNLTATHLFLIAQEAVHNAIKHASARAIQIVLKADDELTLSVQDDGIGLPESIDGLHGLGLRIMRNRAAIAGASLTIKPAHPTGTVVTCVLPSETYEPK
jgi:signal transduction histidine kinase